MEIRDMNNFNSSQPKYVSIDAENRPLELVEEESKRGKNISFKIEPFQTAQLEMAASHIKVYVFYLPGKVSTIFKKRL